ncbi:hypothetical protein OK074_2691 [Actinobacteria bacterium OK074]|nr:hypothetical protein OK074_2691 [Actinobacteria bacterium OK074]
MMGDSFQFGDSVSMHGGTGNTGIVKHTAESAGAKAVAPLLHEAVQELMRLLQELRGQVAAPSAQTIDDSLASISTEGDTDSQRQHQALMAVAGIAATVGAIGQPVLDSVTKVLALLGVGQ